MTEMKIEPQPGMSFGMVGIVLGAAALLLVLLQFTAGPFAPQPSIGETIGQIAADMRVSAWNRLRGTEVAPTVDARPWDIDRIMIIGSMVMAVIAVVLGTVGYIREERGRAVRGAVSFGIAAILFQFMASALLLILGVVLLMGIMANINQILGGFGDMFGG